MLYVEVEAGFVILCGLPQAEAVKAIKREKVHGLQNRNGLAADGGDLLGHAVSVGRITRIVQTGGRRMGLGVQQDISVVRDGQVTDADDLAGWQERAHGQTKQHPGILQSFNLGKPAIEQLILNARVKAGWIEPIEIPAPAESEEAQEESSFDEDLAAPEEGVSHGESEEKAL